jgi:uncharacterized membrane protein YphA (DoxX/SURF4 family)
LDGLSRVGRILFGVAIVLFGLQYLFHAQAAGPAPGPPWTAEMGFLAWLIGVGFVAAGVCIAARLWARLAAALLGVALLLRVLLVYAPNLFAHLRDPGPWTSGFELLALSAVALVLAGELESPGSRLWEGLIVGRLLYAAALVVFGVQHLLYAKFIAALIPAWIPGHLFWAYFVGAMFFVAALSIATNMQGHLAATLLGLMFLLWVVVLHVPRVVAMAHSGNEWTSAFVALAMSGGAWVLAGALHGEARETR